MDKTALELSLHSLHWWTVFWSIVVAAGVLGETILEFAVDDERRQRLRKYLAGCLGLAVFFGLLGEFLAERRVYRVEESLQMDADVRVAQANAAAAQAHQEAKAAELQSSANEREAARLKVLAEAERLARVRLERSTAERTLAKNGSNDMAARLKVYQRQRASIFYQPLDPEALGFAQDLQRTLAQANWSSSPLEALPVIITDGPGVLAITQRRGVWLQFSRDARSLQAGSALAAELRGAGFDVHAQIATDSQCGTSMVCVVVQHRPRGPQG
jgi:hypothetical protein